MIDHVPIQTRSVRALLTAFSLVCVLAAGTLTAFPSLRVTLQGFVHTDEKEWQDLYRHLIDNLPLGLIIAAAAARVVHFAYSHIPKILNWCISLPSGKFLIAALCCAGTVRLVWILVFTSR